MEEPEQHFLTPSNPELVFGKQVEEVFIRDVRGRVLWEMKRGNSSQIIVWYGTDKDGESIESGLYIYQMRTSDGKRKYGVAVIAK